MNLDDFDPAAIDGTRACIENPETAYDIALGQIYTWYLTHFQKRVDPPFPDQLLSVFRALTDSEEDFKEAAEIAICLAHYDAQAPSDTRVTLTGIRLALNLLRLLG